MGVAAASSGEQPLAEQLICMQSTLQAEAGCVRPQAPSTERGRTCRSGVPASTVICSVCASRASLTFWHSSHSCVWYCWYMPGPTWRVTVLSLQLHCRLPLAGLMTALSRTTCARWGTRQEPLPPAGRASAAACGQGSCRAPDRSRAWHQLHSALSSHLKGGPVVQLLQRGLQAHVHV